jgi:hypothetical protein
LEFFRSQEQKANTTTGISICGTCLVCTLRIAEKLSVPRSELRFLDYLVNLAVSGLNFVQQVFLTSIMLPAQGLERYIFYAALDEKLQPTLNFEHTEHKWMTFDKAKVFPLISGCPEHLDRYKELIDHGLYKEEVPEV